MQNPGPSDAIAPSAAVEASAEELLGRSTGAIEVPVVVVPGVVSSEVEVVEVQEASSHDYGPMDVFRDDKSPAGNFYRRQPMQAAIDRGVLGREGGEVVEPFDFDEIVVLTALGMADQSKLRTIFREKPDFKGSWKNNREISEHAGTFVLVGETAISFIDPNGEICAIAQSEAALTRLNGLGYEQKDPDDIPLEFRLGEDELPVNQKDRQRLLEMELRVRMDNGLPFGKDVRNGARYGTTALEDMDLVRWYETEI